MAKLGDLMPEFQDETKLPQKKPSNVSKIKAVGRKRRAWLEDNEEGTNTSENSVKHTLKTENFQPHKKPDLSTIPINHVDQYDSSPPFINPVNKPLNGKGSIKGVYRPDSLCLADLRSNPLQLIRFFFALTKEENHDHQTRRVRLREVMQHLDISKDSARTALRFLLKQGLIKRVAFKAGQLGWSKYQLKKSLCDEIESAITKGVIDPFEVSPYVEHLKGSNSSNNYITTTNNIDHIEWGNIDTSPLESIGLTKKHLLQIKTKIDPSLVQESINHFSYAIQHNHKIKKYDSPLAAFISVLKRGEPWIEPNYRTPQEMAQSLLVEQKKAERERLKKLEEDAYKLALEEWQEILTTEQLEEIAPPKKGRADLVPQHVKLSMYFRENVWPEKKKEYLV